MTHTTCFLFLAAFLTPCLAEEGVIVIDDSDEGFADFTAYEDGTPFPGGTPIESYLPSNAFDGSAHHSLIVEASPPVLHVSWTFAGLDPTRSYDVAVGWDGPPIQIWPTTSLGGEASYTITGTTVETAMLVHNVAPLADYTQVDGNGESFSFQTIARLKPESDGTIVLELRDEDGDALAAVIADAALVCPVGGASPLWC